MDAVALVNAKSTLSAPTDKLTLSHTIPTLELIHEVRLLCIHNTISRTQLLHGFYFSKRLCTPLLSSRIWSGWAFSLQMFSLLATRYILSCCVLFWLLHSRTYKHKPRHEVHSTVSHIKKHWIAFLPVFLYLIAFISFRLCRLLPLTRLLLWHIFLKYVGFDANALDEQRFIQLP